MPFFLGAVFYSGSVSFCRSFPGYGGMPWPVFPVCDPASASGGVAARRVWLSQARRSLAGCAPAEASGPVGSVLETDVERHGGQRERQTEQIGQARVGIAKGRQENVQGINHGAGAIAHQRIDP